MRKLAALTALVALPLVLFAGSSMAHGDGKGNFSARLSGYEEVPSISTNGQGRFEASVRENEIRFTLWYADLTTAPTAAHIHFAQASVAGGVIAFLCGGGGKPACPGSGTVTGTIVPSNIIGPSDQGIAAGEFAEVVRAMQYGVTYVNAHTSTFPNGEIRGQIRHGRGHDDFGRDKKHGDDDD